MERNGTEQEYIELLSSSRSKLKNKVLESRTSYDAGIYDYARSQVHMYVYLCVFLPVFLPDVCMVCLPDVCMYVCYLEHVHVI